VTKRAFPPELRTASVVPRWSIVWTLTRDTVSNHSFYVTFYAREIARLIKWPGDHGNLMYRAMTHDLDELITGDIVSPVKREIIDDRRAAEFIDAKMSERFAVVMRDLDELADEARFEEEEAQSWDIIKAADRLDALLFLIIEQRMGNSVIAPRISPAWSQLEASWRKLPADQDTLDRTWNTVVVPAVNDHATTGGYGI
jgi:5'-deoxynucleotidase